MSTYDDVIAAPRARSTRLRPGTRTTFFVGLLFWAVIIGVGIYWCVVWAQGGGDGASGFKWRSETQIFLNFGRITALLSGYLALVEVLLLARLPFIERVIG